MGLKIVLMNCPNPVLSTPDAHFQLGLLYIGSVLKRAGHDVSIKDLRSAKEITPDDVPAADVVGVTATSGEFHFALQIAGIARAKGAMTMIGGAHATFLPETCDDFDYCVIGDGEEAVLNALGGPPGRYQTPPVKIDGYFPDWGLIGERGFSKELYTGAGYGTGPLAAGSLTSRGCPNRCSYCREKPEMVRFRPVKDVVQELNYLMECGVRHFRFYDECMTLNKTRAIYLFNCFQTMNIRWRAHTRADIFDDDIAKAAKAGGCEELGFGFEVATQNVLGKIRKRESLEQFAEALRICRQNGIISKAFWMVGLPGQGWPEIKDIKNFMSEHRPDKWIVSVFSPYPGSDVWARPDHYGVKWMEKDLSKYWNFPDSPAIAYHDNDVNSIWEQYINLKKWLEEKFPR